MPIFKLELQQGFAVGETGFIDQFALQKSYCNFSFSTWTAASPKRQRLLAQRLGMLDTVGRRAGPCTRFQAV